MFSASQCLRSVLFYSIPFCSVGMSLSETVASHVAQVSFQTSMSRGLGMGICIASFAKAWLIPDSAFSVF